MRPPLTESDIEPSVAAFAAACSAQLTSLGFATLSTGQFALRLTDLPITKREDRRSWHGRIRFRGPELVETYWPYSDDPGIYLFFGKDGAACYVGKAEVTLGSRLGSHLGARGANYLYENSSFPEAEYVIVLPFTDAPFLAPAFESFLLSRFSFPRNRMLAGEAPALDGEL